jgi:hypothetical protein
VEHVNFLVVEFQQPSSGKRIPETLYCALHKLLVVQITAFFPSVEEQVFLLCEEGTGTPRGGGKHWVSVLSGEAGLLAPTE